MPPAVDVERLLVEAAGAAVEQEISIEAFMLTALAAYLRVDPELVAALRDRALFEQLEELGRDGRLPVA